MGASNVLINRTRLLTFTKLYLNVIFLINFISRVFLFSSLLFIIIFFLVGIKHMIVNEKYPIFKIVNKSKKKIEMNLIQDIRNLPKSKKKII